MARSSWLAGLLIAWVVCVAAPCVGGEPIDVAERLEVEGAQLYLRTRGASPRSPLLLWLHGGPGAAERPLFRNFNGSLEADFLVTYWDQRGAGRSFDASADPRLLTVERHLADLDAIVKHLRARFPADRIVLVGHSWGGALALLYARDHADRLASLALVAPLVATQRSQQSEYAFVRSTAEKRGDEDALEGLAEIGRPPYADARRVLALERLCDRYGGVFHQPPSRLGAVARGLLLGLVTPLEIPRIIRGNERTLEAMQPELVNLDVSRAVPALDVPVLLLLGRHDRHVDSAIAEAYLRELRAPSKRLVWFERSAHNPPFEEPARFNAVLREELLPNGPAPD